VTDSQASAERRLGRPALAVLLVVLALGLVWASVDPFTVLFYVPYALVGLLLVYRRPGNVVSWLILAIGFTFLTTTTTPTIDPDALARGTAPADHVFQAWLAGWAGSLTFVAYTALTIVFPSGRLPSGRWRWPSIALLVAAFLVAVVPAFATLYTARELA
jgi:hypothetical protein